MKSRPCRTTFQYSLFYLILAISTLEAALTYVERDETNSSSSAFICWLYPFMHSCGITVYSYIVLLLFFTEELSEVS